MLIKASSASVDWDPKHKKWQVHIHVGAEVIKRPLPDLPQDASEEAMRSAAIETARAEGYELSEANVAIDKAGVVK